MAMVKILQYPNLRLRKKGKKVEAITPEITQIIDDMFETLYNTDNCAALAATQLDFADPYHITVIDISPEKSNPICLVNAEIIERKGEQYEQEGCMSVPGGTYEKVKRDNKIKVRALDQKGEPIEREEEGYMAKCIQHELDHLDGKLFIDRLSGLKRRRIDTRLTKLRKAKAS